MSSIGAKDKVRTGANFAIVEMGAVEDLDQYSVSKGDFLLKGKVFLREILDLTAMEVSMNKLAAGDGGRWKHCHVQNEEVYVFLDGKGQMQVDGEIFEVHSGTAVRVDVNGKRSIRNNSSDPLYYVCIQAKANSLQQCSWNDATFPKEKPEW